MVISRATLIGIAMLIVSIYVSLWFFGDLRHLLTVETLCLHKQFLIDLVQQNYYHATALYILIYIVHSSLALPATSLLIIAGGMLFGIPATMAYASLGSLIGGTNAFLASRFLFGEALHRRYGPQLQQFHQQFMRHHSRYLLIIRCMPIIPFCLINVLSGLSLVPIRTFIWTLMIGILPSLYLYSAIGTEISLMQNPWDLLNYNMVITCILIGICICGPIAYTRITRTRTP